MADHREAADQLKEIKEEITELLANARGALEGIGGMIEQRAEAYWLAHIEAALEADFSMGSMQDTIDEIETELAEEEAQEEKDQAEAIRPGAGCDKNCPGCGMTSSPDPAICPPEVFKDWTEAELEAARN